MFQILPTGMCLLTGISRRLRTELSKKLHLEVEEKRKTLKDINRKITERLRPRTVTE